MNIEHEVIYELEPTIQKANNLELIVTFLIQP